MNACRLIAQLVGQMHGDLLTNVGPNCWHWPLIVNSYDWSFIETIRVPIDPGDVPIIDSSIHVRSVGCHEEEGGYREQHGNWLE